MIEETLSSSIPGIEIHPAHVEKKPASAAGQAAAKKNVSSRTAGKPVSRQQKLVLHLWIGLLMAGLVITGYALLGPDTRASAAQYPVIDVAASVPAAASPQTGTVLTIDPYDPTSDLAALQAEMAELTRQINAIQAAGVPVPAPVGSSVPTMLWQASATQDPIQVRLNEMMSMTHEMIDTMNRMNGQAGGTGGQAGHH